MRNLVEAGFDVTLDDPLIAAWKIGEIAHLGHRVMRPTVRAEPIRAGQEIHLEDRL